MRVYQRVRIDSFKDKTVRKEMQKVDIFLRQLSTQQARIPALPQGSTPISGSGGATVDLNQFLYLPGRTAGQNSKQRVTFQSKVITAQGTSTNPTQDGFGFRAIGSVDGQMDVNISIEEKRTGLTKLPIREWIFPAFNKTSDGPSLSFFVDESNYQTMTRKTITGSDWEMSDAGGNGFVYDPGGTRSGAGTSVQAFNILCGSGFPTVTWPYSAAGNAAVDGIQPMIYMPALDASQNSSSGGASAVRDKSHVFGIVKIASNTATPFEDAGLIYGGGSRKELYSMPGRAMGTLAAPASGAVPMWFPSISTTGTFTTSTATVTAIPSTTGMTAGMRIRMTTASHITQLGEDVYIKSVDSGTQITLSATYGGAVLAAEPFIVFGSVWSSTATLPMSIGDVYDNLFRIVDNGDTTKKIAFEVSGLTTATTRTYTAPNYDGTLILSQGSSSTGQVIGTSTASSGGVNDLKIQGRLVIGSLSTSFSTGRPLNVQESATTGSFVFANFAQVFDSTTTGGASNGTYTNVQITQSGQPAWTSGNPTLRAFFISSSPNCPAGMAMSAYGGIYQVAPTEDASATGVSGAVGLQARALGPASSGNSTKMGGLIGMELKISSRARKVLDAFGILIQQDSNLGTETVDNFYGVSIGTTSSSALPMPESTVANWKGYYIENASVSATNKWGLWIGCTFNNVLNGKLRVGNTTDPSHWLDIAAGTTSVAPIRLNSGTSLTSPVAGTIEFTTDDFFATITTGPARKAFVLDDGTRLTSGRVPFATTNGRLVDDADMTFAVDTLTITKIAATTFTGNPTLNDGVDVPVGTGTGTKIATATTQKLGFWNTVPVVQPTTAIAAATFVANTSGIVDDSATFDGYTIGQIVKALRTIGVLA